MIGIRALLIAFKECWPRVRVHVSKLSPLVSASTSCTMLFVYHLPGYGFWCIVENFACYEDVDHPLMSRFEEIFTIVCQE